MFTKNTKKSLAIVQTSQMVFMRMTFFGLFLVGLVWISGNAQGAATPLVQGTAHSLNHGFITTWTTNRATAELKLRQLKRALSKNSYHADQILDRIESLQRKLHGER